MLPPFRTRTPPPDVSQPLRQSRPPLAATAQSGAGHVAATRLRGGSGGAATGSGRPCAFRAAASPSPGGFVVGLAEPVFDHWLGKECALF